MTGGKALDWWSRAVVVQGQYESHVVHRACAGTNTFFSQSSLKSGSSQTLERPWGGRSGAIDGKHRTRKLLSTSPMPLYPVKKALRALSASCMHRLSSVVHGLLACMHSDGNSVSQRQRHTHSLILDTRRNIRGQRHTPFQ